MSDRRKLTSPENGRLSKGPITQAGKDRSSRNAFRHGLLAKNTVLTGECEELFEDSIKSYYARFQPQDEVEESLVDDMASSYWRIQRLAAIETRLLNNAIEHQSSDDGMGQIAGAFTRLADSAGYKLLQRYDAHLHRTFHRAKQDLIDLKNQLPCVEPSTAVPPLPIQQPPTEEQPPQEPVLGPQPPLPTTEEPNETQIPVVPQPPTQAPDSRPLAVEIPPANKPISAVQPLSPPHDLSTKEPTYRPSDPFPAWDPWDRPKAA